MIPTVLHFTLGPVQGFIADARRTRDLWAGSFLLSWLAGHAMAALVEAAGGDKKIIAFPDVAGDDLFAAIEARRHSKPVPSAPYVGSLPNRFKADVTGIEDPAAICEKAIRDAWKLLAGAVWEQFVDGDVANIGKETQTIWDRQVACFWDIAWVVGEKEPGNDGQWLDQRKNWRSHYGGEDGEEGGDLCRLMGRFQEISGYHRIGEREKQESFYAELRERTYENPYSGDLSRLGDLNLGEDERLCAIALIKRLFPLLDDIDKVIGWRPGGEKLNVINWPSVSYLAAVPWLKAASGEKKFQSIASLKYSECATDSLKPGFKGETETKLFGLPSDAFFKLDGHLYFEDGIRSWDTAELRGQSPAEKERNRANLLRGLKSVCGAVAGKPSEFYAVLLMDGDRIGAKIGEYPDVVKDGLAHFTGSVKEYFAAALGGNSANGVLIYAGGDDVLALVPVDTALQAARDMRRAYRAAFVEAIAKDQSKPADVDDFTMSGAIVFSQYKIPLRAVLDKAHHYLDKVAKEGNGRDSLAVAVMKPGGVAFDWVSVWEKDTDPVSALEAVAKRADDYSASFFYNVRERYARLFQVDDDDYDEDDDRDIDRVFAEPKFMRAVLTAEYRKQPDRAKLDKIEVEQAIAPLMLIGRPLDRTSGAPVEAERFHFDSALVARFLAVEGRWALLGDGKAGGKTDG